MQRGVQNRRVAFQGIAQTLGHGEHPLTLPEVKQQLAREGVETAPDSPEQFGKFIQSEIAKFARIIKESGARAE